METFTYSGFAIRADRESTIRKGHKHNVEVGVMCPRCDRRIGRALDHGEKATCPECGLVVQRFGNALEAANG